MLVSPAEIRVFINRTGSAFTDADAALLTLIHGPAEACLKQYLQTNFEYQQYVEFYPAGGQEMPEPDPLNEEFDLSAASGKVLPVVGGFAGGAGSDRLQLRHTPVVLTDLEVREDVSARAGQGAGDFPSSSVLTLGEDYWLDLDEGGSDQLSRSGILWRNGLWPTTARTVKVTYYGGWTAAQLAGKAGNVKMAALKTVAAAFWKAKQWATNNGGGSIVSERIGKYAKTLGNASSGGVASIASSPFTVPPEAMNDLESMRVYRLFA